MGLGGPLVVKAAALAAVSASSLRGIPMCPGIHRSLVGHSPRLGGILGDGSLQTDVPLP